MTKREQAYKKLRHAIIFGDLKPGEKIVERDISKRFDIGTTPIREAIRQLESEGLVEVFANRGAFVRKITPKDATDAYDVVAVLEGYTVKIATEKMTKANKKYLRSIMDDIQKAINEQDFRLYLERNEAFHDMFHGIAGNEVLSRQIYAVRNQFFRFIGLLVNMPGHLDKALKTHEEIVNAIEADDAEGAGKCMQRHLQEVKQDLADLFSRTPWL